MADEGKQTATSEQEKRGRGRSIAPVLAAVGLVLLCLAVGYYRYFISPRSNIWRTEAGEAIDKIKGGARQYYVTDHWDTNGNLLPRAFPSNISMTPKTGPNCDKVHTPTEVWDTHGWGLLHFELTEPHYYAYEFLSDGLTGTRATYTARAYSDFDCDKIWSTYEIRGSIDEEGSVKVEGPIFSNEIE
jgi:hypothetical protein